MMSAKTIFIFFLISILSLGFSGCVTSPQPPPKIDYYTLEYDAPTPDLPGPIRSIIRVERFQVAPIYNTTNIIYKETSFKRNAYHYHKWRANPGDLVTYFLARDLRDTGLFNGVFILSSKYPASHIIDGTLDRFYLENVDQSWLAVLSVNITFMVDFEPDISKRILFQKRYTSKKKCELRNPKSLAAAMSQAMNEISKTIIQDIYSALTTQR